MHSVRLAHIFHTAILRLIDTFGVVFFFELFGESTSQTLLLFGIIYLSSGMLTIFMPYIVKQIGSNKSLILSVSLYFATFIFINIYSSFKYSIIIALYIIVFTVARSLYSFAFYLYLLEFASAKKMGRNMGGLISFTLAANAIVPLIGGYLSKLYGSMALVFLALILIIFPVFVYSKLPKVKINYKVNLNEILKDRTFYKLSMTAAWGGMISPVAFIWSLWIYLILSKNILELGVFVTILTLCSILISRLMGNFLDSHNKKEAWNMSNFLVSIELFIKAFATNPFTLVIGDLLGRLNGSIHSVAFNTYYFSWVDHHDQKELLDERINIGHFMYDTAAGISFILLAIICLFYPINYGFLLLGVLYLLGFIIMEVLKYRGKK